jgi:hypothetical protein
MYKEKGRKRKEKKRLTMLVREVHWSHRCALHAENKSKANPCFSSQDPSIFFISKQDKRKTIHVHR